MERNFVSWCLCGIPGAVGKFVSNWLCNRLFCTSTESALSRLCWVLYPGTAWSCAAFESRKFPMFCGWFNYALFSIGELGRFLWKYKPGWWADSWSAKDCQDPEILKHHSSRYKLAAAGLGLQLCDEEDTILFQRNARFPDFFILQHSLCRDCLVLYLRNVCTKQDL